MTRVFLAAGVAALAITAPAQAGPHGGGGHQAQAQQQPRGGGAARMQAQRAERAPRMQQMAAPRVERMQRMAAPRMQQQRLAAARPARAERVQMRAERQQMRQAPAQRAQARMAERPARADRQQLRANRVEQAQARQAARQQHVQPARVQAAQNMQAQRQQLRAERQAQVQNMRIDRQQLRTERLANAGNKGIGYGVGGCPPGLANKSVACMPPGQAAKLGLNSPMITAANVNSFRTARVDALNNRFGTRLLAPATAASLIGLPLSQATTMASLSPLPNSVQYLYPDTSDYYYRYGDGYLYQVDRGSNLIAALLPLLGGGYMPGQYLPSSYMNSYVPDYWGMNSFYPSSYSGYGYGNGYGNGYGYDNLCNRYMNGVVYQVDCTTGMVQNVIPTYAGGYGVGQMLPSDYSYYNVPQQYRSMYYDNADSGYWYAPGAIYQYDQGSSMITSVAALLSPGFSVGQQLPMGYDTYNVPYAYRATYYDTPNAWYRYNNGYIYQVDPTTQLVSAIVASILT